MDAAFTEGPGSFTSLGSTQGTTPALDVALEERPGGPMRWQAPPDADAEHNLGNGHKQTDLPIVEWVARGGMNLGFTLFHNSQSSVNSVLGPKWTHSYQIYLTNQMGGVSVTWGDGTSYTFLETAPGIFSSLHLAFTTLWSATWTMTFTSLLPRRSATTAFVISANAGAALADVVTDFDHS